jgi:uncharacterized protein
VPLARLAAKTPAPGMSSIGERPRTGSLDEIAASKRTLLVTYRRDGTPVPTPVWAARAGMLVYVRTERGSGKVKRLRRDERMLIAPCTLRGRPLGAPLEAHARVLPTAEEAIAEHALSGRYGPGRELFERTMDALRVDMCYVEVTPGDWAQSLGRGA